MSTPVPMAPSGPSRSKGIGGICHPPPLDCAAACKLARMDAGIRSNIDRPDTGTKA